MRVVFVLALAIAGLTHGAAAQAPARPEVDDVKLAHKLVMAGYRCELPLDFKLLSTRKDGSGFYRLRCRARDICFLYSNSPPLGESILDCSHIHPPEAAEKLLHDD
jgi:hypothetical protein